MSPLLCLGIILYDLFADLGNPRKTDARSYRTSVLGCICTFLIFHSSFWTLIQSFPLNNNWSHLNIFSCFENGRSLISSGHYYVIFPYFQIGHSPSCIICNKPYFEVIAIKREIRYFLCRTHVSSSDIKRQKEQLISQGYLAVAIIGSTESTRTLEKTLRDIIQNHWHQQTSS